MVKIGEKLTLKVVKCGENNGEKRAV